jgi:hypothetical protein
MEVSGGFLYVETSTEIVKPHLSVAAFMVSLFSWTSVFAAEVFKSYINFVF